MSTTREASVWPDIEAGLDLVALIEAVVVAARRSPALPPKLLADELAEELGAQFVEAAASSSHEEMSTGAELFSAFVSWVSSDWQVIQRGLLTRKAEEKLAEELGMEKLRPAARDGFLRCRQLSVRLIAALYVLDPAALDGQSMRSLSVKFGMKDPALISLAARDFNRTFGIRGRGQKGEEACEAYSEAQEGNHNRQQIFAGLSRDFFPESEGTQNNNNTEVEEDEVNDQEEGAGALDEETGSGEVCGDAANLSDGEAYGQC